MVFGIDIGTTSVAGVAVDAAGRVIASATVAHHADLPSNGQGVDEQSPRDLLAAVESVRADLLAQVSPRACPLGFGVCPPDSSGACPPGFGVCLPGSSGDCPPGFGVCPLGPSGDCPPAVPGDCPPIGWTGQMHGVVAVNGRMEPISPFVTWRDARRYGGPAMAQWGQSLERGQSPFAGGQTPFKCLPVCGLPLAVEGRKCLIDPSFLESWHLEMGTVPTEWLPDVVEGSMLGDNQAGVYAAQRFVPGCAVVNLGTSGQLSVVDDGDSPLANGDRPQQAANGDRPLSEGDRPQRAADGDSPQARVERRWFPDGRMLLCRASLVGGQAWAALQRETGVPWEELNAAALSNGDSPLARRARACAEGIVEDLVAGIDLRGVKGIVGVGNALVRNPALREALERRFELPCLVPPVSEMAAYGAALYKMNAVK